MKKIAPYLKSAWIRLIYGNSLNMYLGMKIYKNNSGFIANFVGNRIENKISLGSKKKLLSPTYCKEVDFFRINGYLRLPNERSDKVCQLAKDFDRHAKKMPIPKSLRLECSSIGNEQFYDKFPYVKKILNTRVIEIIRAFYQSDFRVLNTHIYRTFSIQDACDFDNVIYGSTENWHNDGSTVESIKIFVLLTNVSESDGPMFLLDRTSSAEIFGSGLSIINNFRPGSALDTSPGLIKFTGKVGDMLLANTNICLHRASQPKNGCHRDMLVYYVTCTKNKQTQINYGSEEQYFGFSRFFTK